MDVPVGLFRPRVGFFAAARAVVAGIEFVGDLRRVVQGGVYAVIARRGLDVVAVLRKASVRPAEVYRPVVVRTEFEFPGGQCDVDPETLFLGVEIHLRVGVPAARSGIADNTHRVERQLIA